jgi:hypothetical protein
LTGYAHPFGHLLCGHSKRLPQSSDPSVWRGAHLLDLAELLEPLLELAQLDDAKSFSHNILKQITAR